MFDEPFAHGRSLVHAVDPRFRLVAAFVCAVCLTVVRTPEAAWFGFGMAALLLALSRPPMRPVLRRLAVVNVFIAFLWLTVPLTSGGDVIAAWGPLEVSRAGVLLTLLVTIKSNAIVMTFLALVATMDSPTIGYALERLRFPSKLVFLFLFTYRYLHVIAMNGTSCTARRGCAGSRPRPTCIRTVPSATCSAWSLCTASTVPCGSTKP